MGLFSKKPGGTFFGNLLRGVANSVSGGALGNGANRIEVGQTKTNAQLAAEAGDLEALIAQQQAALQAGASIGNAIRTGVATQSGAVPVGGSFNLLLIVGAVGALLYFLFKK